MIAKRLNRTETEQPPSLEGREEETRDKENQTEMQVVVVEDDKKVNLLLDKAPR